MSYKRIKAFEHANQNLIFHTQAPPARWCFPRPHLIYAAAAGPNQIHFRFPLQQVEVTVEGSAPTVLESVLRGEQSLFIQLADEARGNAAGAAGSPEAQLASQISIKFIYEELAQD